MRHTRPTTGPIVELFAAFIWTIVAITSLLTGTWLLLNGATLVGGVLVALCPVYGILVYLSLQVANRNL